MLCCPLSLVPTSHVCATQRYWSTYGRDSAHITELTLNTVLQIIEFRKYWILARPLSHACPSTPQCYCTSDAVQREQTNLGRRPWAVPSSDPPVSLPCLPGPKSQCDASQAVNQNPHTKLFVKKPLVSFASLHDRLFPNKIGHQCSNTDFSASGWSSTLALNHDTPEHCSALHTDLSIRSK